MTSDNLVVDPSGGADDIEDEETGFQDIERPWDPESIRVSTNNFSIRNMIDLIAEHSLDLAPDFQRLRVWTPVQKAQLIESLLLQIPLPAFYFAEDTEGRLQVVDGVQRLSTIYDFVRGGHDGAGGFRLDGLEYIADVKGARFVDLPVVWQRRIYNTQIVAHVIAPSTPAAVMYDVFRRINTGGTPLTAQEIRHCITKTRSRTFLQDLVAIPAFDKVTGGKLLGHRRMVDREVALRFSAFWLLGPSGYTADETLDGFLLRAARALDDPKAVPDTEMRAIASAFEQGLLLADAVFDGHAFRKWPLGDDRTKPFNKALFEAWTVQLARRDTSKILSFTHEIAHNARVAMANDVDYIASISSSTGDIRRVKFRFDRTEELIARAIS